jgi:molybdopterin adenylyltransferase
MTAQRPDDSRPFIPVRFAVVTVSDTRTSADDRSGDTLAGRIEEAGHVLAGRTIVADDVEAIRASVRGFVADNVDAVITTGGTGFTGRDVTPEALEPLFDKAMDGFSAVFHRISYDARSAPRRSSRGRRPG